MDYLVNLGLFFKPHFIAPFNFNSISRGVRYPIPEDNLLVLYQLIKSGSVASVNICNKF
jgi:hypothetical protein